MKTRDASHGALPSVAALLALAFGAVPYAACSTPPAAEGPAVPAIASKTAEVLAAARRAAGWDALRTSGGAVRVTGAARFLGTDATRVALFDAAGRYIESFDGPLSQSSGSDGAVTWARDWSGTPRILVLGDRTQGELERLFVTGAWTLGDGALSFDDEARREGDELVLSFRHPDGILSGSIRLDARTHRARSAVYATDTTPTTWTFEGWTEHHGIAYPARIAYETEGRAQSFTTRTVERLARAEPGAFAPRLERPRDTRFDASLSAALEVQTVRTGHVLVHPLVNGKDLGWFIFDTGAGTNCISNEVTAELGTEPFGEIAARGVGGTVAARFWRAGELRLGPVTVEAPVFMGLDLAFLEPHFGVRVGGILGYELLARCVAEVDMQAGAIALHDPERYRLPADAGWEELLLYGRHPCVRAGFEGHAGVFRVDTGAAGDTVTFHYQVVADLGLADGRETRGGHAGGVGGFVGTKVGSLASFRLGGRDLGAIEASFALEDQGAFADDYTAGNIGGKLLEPFRLVFDYPGGRVAFLPR
ncbi:MAG: retropepsin-like domain-containing protein [Planctomycetes bacterium]|nr:retropepsin-like domain-containing protein [Planctomycetota bacterium]